MNRSGCATNDAGEYYGYAEKADTRLMSDLVRLVDSQQGTLPRGLVPGADTVAKCAARCNSETSADPARNCQSFSFKPAGSSGSKCILGVAKLPRYRQPGPAGANVLPTVLKVVGFTHLYRDANCDQCPHSSDDDATLGTLAALFGMPALKCAGAASWCTKSGGAQGSPPTGWEGLVSEVRKFCPRSCGSC